MASRGGVILSWFKVDDKLHDHRKARAAGSTAMGVWLLAGSWSADNLTDGFIPAPVLGRWGRPRDAARLVEVGLWEATVQDGEDGWRFHEWDEFQPTRAQKEAEREAKREAGRIGGLRSGRTRREAAAKQAASGQVELPSRPVPTTKRSSSSGDDGFDQWWSLYPKKINKEAARKKWLVVAKKVPLDDLMGGLRRYVDELELKSVEAQYVKGPDVWLNKGCWADEYEAATSDAPVASFSPPAPPDDMPAHLFRAWNIAHQQAHRRGEPGPSDWHSLIKEAS